MNYTEDFDINTFDFWCGAKDTIKTVEEAGKLGELSQIIEETFSNKTPSKTEINDFVWFESDRIFDMLGIESN